MSGMRKRFSFFTPLSDFHIETKKLTHPIHDSGILEMVEFHCTILQDFEISLGICWILHLTNWTF